MKKLLSGLLVLALLLSLSGCFLPTADLSDLIASLPLEDFFEPSATQGVQPPIQVAPNTSAPDSDRPALPQPTLPTEELPDIDPEGFYYSKEDVALYIHVYGELPPNFVTKSQAKQQFGSNYKAMQAGYRIGGDTFQNREGLLPKKSGRTYTECDILPLGETQRNACRIVFSNDGLVYYTDDHYASFTLLYGEP